MKKRLLLQLTLLALIAGCGGGGGGGGGNDDASPPPNTPPVGEIFGTPAHVVNAEIVSNYGYAGNLETSRAIQKAGKSNMLDFLFMFPTHAGGKIRLAENAVARLDSYIAQNSDLLVPGVHLYLIDEMYLGAALLQDDPQE